MRYATKVRDTAKTQVAAVDQVVTSCDANVQEPGDDR